MSQVVDNNFNFIEKKKPNRVRVVTANPAETERASFFGSVGDIVRKGIGSANDGIGDLDDDIRNALKSNSNGNTDDYYSSQGKKKNAVVEALAEDLKKKLSNSNSSISDPNTKKSMDDFLSSLGRDDILDSLGSLDDILSMFKKVVSTDPSLSEEFESFLRKLKKLLDSYKVTDKKVLLDLSEVLELLNSEDSDFNEIIKKFLSGLFIPDYNNTLADNILDFFRRIKNIKFVDKEPPLLRVLKKRYSVDLSPVKVYEFSDYGITDSNVPQLIKDSNIERLYIDGKEITDFLDLSDAKGFIENANSKEVSLPIWAQESWRDNNEKRLKEFYKTVRSAKMGSDGNAPEWKKNDYVNVLNTLLNPVLDAGENGMNPGIPPDIFALLIVQSFYTSDPLHPTIRSNVTLKNGVMIPKEIKMTDFGTKKAVSKSFFEVNEKEIVRIYTQATRNGSSLYNNLEGHVILPHIQLSPEDNLTPIGDVVERQDAEPNMATQHAVHNSAIKCLLRKMPDFRPNMYYGVISQYDENDEEIKDILAITGKMPFEKNIGSQLEQVLKTYFVRLQKVSINGMSSEQGTWNFMGRQISKVSSSFTESHKTELEFSLDQNGLILNKFNALAGIFGSNFEDTVIMNDAATMKDGVETMVSLAENNFYSQTFFPSTFFNNKSRIDITIMYNDFNTLDHENHFSSYGATQKLIMNTDQTISNSKFGKTYGYQSSYRAFVFEDVRFLGSNSALKFERDTGGKISGVSIPILYKRISTIDNNF